MTKGSLTVILRTEGPTELDALRFGVPKSCLSHFMPPIVLRDCRSRSL
jgi:hypothetical protein